MVVGTTAEVHLDEVEAQLLEEEVGILLVVLVESYALADDVAIEHAATGVAPGIAVDTGLQPFLVDVVHYALQSVGESGGVNEQLARLWVAPAEITIVDVDVVEAHGFQSFALDGVGLLLNQTLVDVHPVGVPGTPAHGGAVLCHHGCYGGQQADGSRQESLLLHSLYLVISVMASPTQALGCWMCSSWHTVGAMSVMCTSREVAPCGTFHP